MVGSEHRIEVTIAPENGYNSWPAECWIMDLEYMLRRINTTRSINSRLCTDIANRHFEAAKTILDVAAVLRQSKFNTACGGGIQSISLTVDPMATSDEGGPVSSLTAINGDGLSIKISFTITDQYPLGIFQIIISPVVGLCESELARMALTVRLTAGDMVGFPANDNRVLSYSENFPAPTVLISMINKRVNAITDILKKENNNETD